MNRSNTGFRILSAALALALGTGLYAQSTVDTGALKGRITDDKGSPLPGAVVKAKGPQGTKGAETDTSGNYVIPFLAPGIYEVTATMDGFSTQVQSGVNIQNQSTTGQTFKLASGTEIIRVTASALSIDPSSTASVTKVNLQQVIQDFAQPRSFASAFAFSPGVQTNSGVGGGNVSISGASGLENQYQIGGVNITNTGYGALGGYSLITGFGGSGVTTEFLDSLDVYEGGNDAEYGGATGGVISGNIRRGTNDLAASVSTYYIPRSLNGAANNSLSTLNGYNSSGTNNLDVAFSVGGPLIKDKLFYFVAYNPIWNTSFATYSVAQADYALNRVNAPYMNTESGVKSRTDNFAVHLSWNLNERHSFDFVDFGSPARRISGGLRRTGNYVNTADVQGLVYTPSSPQALVSGVSPEQAVAGQYTFNENSISLKYNGAFAPWFTLQAQVSQHKTTTSEKLDDNRIGYTDTRYSRVNAAGNPNFAPVTYAFNGVGSYDKNVLDRNNEYQLKITNNFNFAGSHELKYGIDYADIKFQYDFGRSGPSYVYNMMGLAPGSNAMVRGSPVTITCRSSRISTTATTIGAACQQPRYSVSRGYLNPPNQASTNKETNVFLQDKWTIVPSFTLSLGVRYTRAKLAGGDPPFDITDPYTGLPAQAVVVSDTGVPAVTTLSNIQSVSYTFPAVYSPRIGFTWDVIGNGKSKVYASFSRLYERMPADMQQREFNQEIDIAGAQFRNADLTGQVSSNCIYGFGSVKAGTKLPYKDEFTVGYSFQPQPNWLVDIKGNYRKQGRILEDTQAVTLESYINYYYNYLLTTPGYTCVSGCTAGQTSLFPNYPAQHFGKFSIANPGDNVPGFNPSSKYKALSITLNRMPSADEHLSLQATYRISKATGNYQGLYLPGYGQSDPNISAAFDFPNSPIASGAFVDGPLYVDVPHSLRINLGYRDLWIKNLYGALTFAWQSGQPRSSYLNVPLYGVGAISGINPVHYGIDTNGDGIADRFIIKSYTPAQAGYIGRTPDNATWDAKFGYKWNLGKSNLDFSILVQNLFNDTHFTTFDDRAELTNSSPNPKFGQANSVKGPRTIRLGAKWSF